MRTRIGHVYMFDNAAQMMLQVLIFLPLLPIRILVKPLVLSECIPSAHFLAKRESRGIDWQIVREALEKPSVVEESQHNGSKKLRYVRGDIAVVVCGWLTDHPILVTVLLRESEQWTDEDARNRQRPRTSR